MRYHAALLCLLAIAESACADLDSEYSPFFPKPVFKAGAMAPKSDSGTGAFTAFGQRVSQTPGLTKRQLTTCPATNMHLCSTGGCCPNGYDCGSDSTGNWCCPTGSTCSGAGYCLAGTTDCRSVNGADGCCPTATTFCDKDSSGNPGCREITSGGGGGGGGSGLCVDAGYYPCADLSGCCKTGTTCVAGADYCQKACDTGYSECYGGCCPPGYACNAAGKNCKKTTGGGTVSVTATTTRTTSSSSRVLRSSTTSLMPFTTETEPDQIITSSTSSSSSSSETETETETATSSPTATGTSAAGGAISGSPSGGESLRIPVFGLAIVVLCALAQL